MQNKILLRRSAEILFLILSVFLFIFACGIIQYFIWSDLFVQEFDADVAENVIWAQAAVESKSLVNPDFYYNQLLPFGGQLIFIPIVKHFGVSLFALRLGMSICSGLFALTLAAFFISLGWKISVSFFSSSIILLFLSGTTKLRDIFWSHVVHYNLSIFYLLLSFCFLSMLFRKTSRTRIIGLIGFELCLILGSANDIAVVLFFSLALLFGIVMEAFLTSGIGKILTRENLVLFALTFCGISAGFILGKILTAGASTGYVDLYTVFTSAEEWVSHIFLFPNTWISMFSNLPEEIVPFFSSVGIKLMIRIAAAFLVLCLSIRSLFIWKSLKNALERIFICVHWFITAAILFFFVFGNISTMNWRIIPMFFTSLITAIILLKNDLSDLANHTSQVQLLNIAAAASMLLYSGICAITVFHQSISTEFWFGQNTILKTLADHGLTYGYNLDYWFANSITVLTDEQIKVREVILKDGKLSPSYHQSNIRWYEDQPDVDRYFFVCQEDEYWAHPEFADGAVEILRATQERTFRKGAAGFFIFIYENNIFPSDQG